MEVYKFLNGGDNICYYITMDKATQPGVLVDVWEPEKVTEFLQA